MKKLNKTLLISAIFFMFSCQTMMRTGGAIVGGGAAALLNPIAAPAGIAGGIAVVDLMLQEEELEEQKEQIKALTMGDVHSVVDTAQKGILERIYDLIKLVGIGVGLFFLGSWLWTHKRKKVALQYYSLISDIEQKVKDLQEK